MANRERGEVDLVVTARNAEGAEVTRTLVFRLRTNEFCKLEGMLGLKGPAMLVSLARNMGFREMRAALRAGLSGAQPDISDDEAGDLLDSIGPATIAKLINEALELALPTAKATVGKAESLASPSPGSGS